MHCWFIHVYAQLFYLSHKCISKWKTYFSFFGKCKLAKHWCLLSKPNRSDFFSSKIIHQCCEIVHVVFDENPLSSHAITSAQGTMIQLNSIEMFISTHTHYYEKLSHITHTHKCIIAFHDLKSYNIVISSSCISLSHRNLAVFIAKFSSIRKTINIWYECPKKVHNILNY